MHLNEDIQKKWQPVLEHPDLDKIADSHKRAVTAQILENTEVALRQAGAISSGSQNLFEANQPVNAMQGSSSVAGDGAVDIFDPVLISLVRRAMPNLIAYDICGVQPMTGPTGLIFAMRARYDDQAGAETFYNEVDTAQSTISGGANTLGDKNVGTTPGVANNAEAGLYNFADGMSTSTSEYLGSNSSLVFPEMAFSIEKVTVTAKARALKAEYSMELAQDLKAVHGLDAEAELSNILSSEILAEINREVVRTINVTATQGATGDTTTDGIFDLDTDSNGRWSVEKFKGLMFQVEREANAIAKATRRGKGNIIICSSDVASALQMAGVLDYTPALNSNNLQVDDTGNTFAGVLNGRMRVYIDPYATGNYMTVGYKGSNAFDAGLFYCPYVPLQMVRAVDQDTFQPKIGFKTRYGMVANPFAEGANEGAGALTKDSNVYYRRVLVNNLM
ncbi:MAG: ATP-binding protein [Proteobacteria bacterium]|jgi:hypothetical protein|nr:ATP-binding protein [Pseudomonadota bacterium]